jgi:hypothetical protein
VRAVAAFVVWAYVPGVPLLALSLTVVVRLFPDGVAARFHTAGVTALEHGAVGLHLRRAP